MYRLRVCPELCLGLFSTVSVAPDSTTSAALNAARVLDSSNPNNKSVLLGQIIGTLTASPMITDASMDLPSGSPAAKAEPRDKTGNTIADSQPTKPGHDGLGRTLALHSVCILPQFQNKGLGRILLKSYLQRMEGAGIADHAAIIAHPKLTEWYVRNFGFEDKGASPVTLADGGWKQLVSFSPTF